MPSVAYLGPPGTYSHDAAMRAFRTANFLPVSTLAEVVEAVHDGKTDFAVLPFENSTNGSVALALDSLLRLRGPVRAVGEVLVPIMACVYANGPVGEVTKVYTHPQVWGQVGKWLRSRLHLAERIDTSSTARAVELSLKEPGAAAIAGRAAGIVHDVSPFEQDIADNKSNTTRFLVLKHVQPSEPWAAGEHVLLALEVSHDQPGSLASALGAFKDEGLNLVFATSRPAQRDWTYVWVLEVGGTLHSPSFQRALECLKEIANVCILGTYTRSRNETSSKSRHAMHSWHVQSL